MENYKPNCEPNYCWCDNCPLFFDYDPIMCPNCGSGLFHDVTKEHYDASGSYRVTLIEGTPRLIEAL